MTTRARAVVVSAVLLLAGPVAAAAPATAAPPAPSLSWRLLPTGTDNHFRGLAPVSAQVAWVSGYEGQVLRTVDGGASFTDVSPSRGVAKLQFRDIAAFSATQAVVMAAGPDSGSRLLSTVDGGVTWQVAYRNPEPDAFFDCMAFTDTRTGYVLSDPVDGTFRILATGDGGRSWAPLPSAGMPPAQAGEFAFAASGQCLTAVGRDVWFGTGGTATPRVFHSTNAARTFTATTVPLAGGESAGVFGLAFTTPDRGVIVGGDFAAPDDHARVAATQLRNLPWRLSDVMPTGYRSGVTFVPRTLGTVLAVGLTGSDVSTDGGRTWATFDTGQFDTVSCAVDGSCWAAGDLGRVAVLQQG